MESVTLHQVNAMCAPTWHRLHMNEATVELPALPFARDIAAEGLAGTAGAPGAFEAALAALGAAYLKEGRMGAPAASASSSTEDGDTLDQLALTSFQAHSVAIEASGSLERAFQSGMGDEAYTYLREAAGQPLVITTEPHQRDVTATVRVTGVDGAANVAALDVVAAEGSHVALHVLFDSPQAGSGIVGSSLRVLAGRDARVSITITQTMDDAWIALDDTGMLLDDGARVEVRHTVLGAGSSYTGLAADLRGKAARAAVDTRYLGRDQQVRDFTYTVRHHGLHTESALNANGVLTGSSQKTMRGIIDFVRGCKGSSGQEAETVLLADDRVHNRSIPVILCGEDDVAGNHGATIGHVRPNQLLYLQSRGISAEAAERLFLRAIFEEAALSAPDADARAAVERLAAASGAHDFQEVCS